MSKKNGFNDLVINLLISPRLSIARHLLLLIVLVAMCVGLILPVWGIDAVETGKKYLVTAIFTTVIIGSNYLNIYLLIPGLLVRNKAIAFIGSLLVLSFLSVLCVVLSYDITVKALGIDDTTSRFYVEYTFNMLDGFGSFFFIYMGIAAIVLLKNWVKDTKQTEELESATLQLELQLLENQINPHFLFNMLNNANIMISKDSRIASHIIQRIKAMLLYQITNSNIGEKVALGDDIHFLTDYLELEKIRRDRFVYNISYPENIMNEKIPPLLFIVFVENAIKHNYHGENLSFVNLHFIMIDNRLIFICENSIPPADVQADKPIGGLGLMNVKRRLNLLFPNRHTLKQVKTETTYTVELEIRL